MSAKERVELDKLAFGTCLAGIIITAVIAILGKLLGQNFTMIACGTLLAIEVIALILGVMSFAKPLGKVTTLVSLLLVLGSLVCFS